MHVHERRTPAVAGQAFRFTSKEVAEQEGYNGSTTVAQLLPPIIAKHWWRGPRLEPLNDNGQLPLPEEVQRG